MGIYEEGILPIGLIRKSHLLPHLRLLRLRHGGEGLPVLLIQVIVIEAQGDDDEDQSGQGRDDGDLAAEVARGLRGLEGLGAEDVADAEGDEGEGVGGDLLGVPGDVAGVPREEQHEGRAEGSGQEGGGEEAGLVGGDAVGVEADHEGRAEDGGRDADQHDEGAVVPFVREPADGEDANSADEAGGRVEDQGLLGGVAEGGEEDRGEIRETTVGNRAQHGGEADQPNADVAESFEDLLFLDACVLGAACCDVSQNSLKIVGKET